MLYIYNFVAIFVYLAGILLLLPLSFIKKYNNLYKKFFPFKSHKKADIHFHFASYGEARALAPLINYYKNQGKQVLLTCASKTGFNEGKKIDDNCFYLPFEPILFLWLKPAEELIVFEAELWLNLLYIYKKHNKKTKLINARINKRSFKKYYKFKFLYETIFSYFDFCLAQSYEDSKRLAKLGMKNIQIFTNIKLLTRPVVSKELKKNKKILLLASTHEKEEEIIFSKLKEDFIKDLCVIVAPRHPERFASVEKLILSKYDKKFKKFSEDNLGYLDSEIFLLDTLGELVNFYAISDYVVLGGSFVPVGGHNFAEPAFFGSRIISGKYIFTQLAILKCIDNVKISDDIDFSDVKPAKIKNEYSFTKLCEILKD